MKVRLSRAALFVAVSASALAAPSAWAQDADPADLQDATQVEPAANAKDIVVTGTRASLESAERTKRDAAVLVDGISADDIGALPDTSIAESLVRIPGIASNDRESGFEQVSVRGLGPDLVLVEYNGRVYPTVSIPDRRVNLGDLPSEGIGSATIQKTSDAATIEGGMAGIIGLQPIKPLQTTRTGLSLVARAIEDNIADKVDGPYGAKPYGYRGEVSYIGRLAPNLGVSIDYAYIQQGNISPSLQFSVPRLGIAPTRADLDGNGVVDAFPNTAGNRIGATNQKRHSVIGVVQWDPVSAVRITADGLFLDDGGTHNISQFSAVGTNLSLGVPNSSVLKNDTVTQFDGPVSLYRQTLNNDFTKQRQLAGGLNIAFDDGGPIKVKFDASYARARQNGQNRQITTENDAATAAGQRLNFAFDYRDRENPTATFVPLIADDYALSTILLSNVDLTDTIKAARLDFETKLDLPLFRTLAFGVRIDGRIKDNRPDDNQWSATNVATRPDLDSSYLNVPTNPYAQVARYLGGLTSASFPIFDIDKVLTLRTAPGVVFSDQAANDIAGRSKVVETNHALYLQSNLSAGSLTGNIGVRYLVADVDVNGFIGTTEANKVAQHVTHSNSFWLPALNLRYAVTPELIGRFALYKTASRPTFANLRIGTEFDLTTVASGTIPVVSVGNPNLRPFTAKNADASVEWYPDRSTSLAVQGFYKEASGFVVANQVAGTLVQLDGTPVDVIFNTSINNPKKSRFKGIELIARRDLNFLPGFLRNLGVRADYEHNWTDASQSVVGVGQLSVNALPNNFTQNLFNAQLYYSTKQVDLRLAYRSYSHYLRQADNAYQIRPGGTLDFSGSVELVKNIRLTAIVANLTNAATYEYFPDARNPDNIAGLRNAIWDGRSITAGIRARF